MAVVAVVGDGMAGAPGIAARVFSALAAGGINVVAIAQGSSERNISFAVTADQATRSGAARPRRVPAVEDRRRTRPGGAAHRRRAARLRPRRPRACRSDCAPRTAGPACASSACSIDPATSSTRAASRGAGCRSSRARRTPASCWRRSADAPAQCRRCAGAHGQPRRVAAGRRRRDERGDRRPPARRRSATASTSSSPTRSRSPDRGRATRRWCRRRRTAAGR